MKISRRNLTALGAVVAAVGLGAFVILDLLFANQLTPARATELLQKTSPALVEVLRNRFATDYSRIVEAVIDSEVQLAGDRAIARFLDQETKPITERYDEVGRRAPPPLVKDWLEKLAASMDMVQSVAGAELCSRFVNEGQSVLSDPALLNTLEPGFDARDAAFFNALAGARDAGETDEVGPATDADWQLVGAAMNGLEVPAGYAQIVATDNVASPDYCPALAYYFRVINTLPGPDGDRIRAEYFVRSFS